jgi:predicted acylesterase/phospholipase RssA
MGDNNTGPACDLVLEGGVTSALIYTGLIARLSQHYRLKSLGGTSSGAVAAAAGAIAQRAKLEKPGTPADPLHPSFKALRDFPSRLAEIDEKGRTVLFRLFQPQEGTRRGYHIVATFMQVWGPDRRFAAVVHAIAATLRTFPVAALVGALPGLWYLLVALWSILHGGADDPANWISAAVALLLIVGLGVLAAVAWAVWSTLRGMMRNHFGLCSGMKGAEPSDVLPLTCKLHELFNGLFGRDLSADPVIFGHLWGRPAAQGLPREIDLQVITTALNLRRPFRLPNDPGTDPLRGFFYDPKEWKHFFPGKVMEWLEKHRRLRDGPPLTTAHGRSLFALPDPANWPVLVAVRLSLSFPGLLSAVPMYTLEKRTRAKAGSPPGEPALIMRKVYFSDGGITSNCPVQLFDVPLPGYPTFAVRLDKFKSGEKGSHRIWLPNDDTEPPPSVRPFDATNPAAGAWQFVTGIVNTALEWRDRLQRALPGYRERIVVVGLKPGEGGLNLAMTPRTILGLAALGARAALRLQRAFDGPRTHGPNAWDRHRWLRLRSTLAAAQHYVSEVKIKVAGEIDYRDLLDVRPPMEPRLADDAATAQAKALLGGLSEVAKGDPDVPARDLGENVSQPAPRLRMSPPW